MITTLDSSHKCVLENWETIDQMIACRDQIEPYLKGIAVKALLKAAKTAGSALNQEDHTQKKNWIGFFPKVLLNWNASNDALLNFGIEDITVRSLLFPTSENFCCVWIYSPYYASDKSRKDGRVAIDKLLKVVKPPKGYESSEMSSEDYLLREPLRHISINDFQDPIKLEAVFYEVLLVLVEWWKTYEQAILKTLK